MHEQQITHVGIVGAGTMGARIAGHCVLCGQEVYLYDISPQVLARAHRCQAENPVLAAVGARHTVACWENGRTEGVWKRGR